MTPKSKSGIHIEIPTEALMMMLHPEAAQGSTGAGASHPDDYYKSHLGGDSGPGRSVGTETMGGASSSSLGAAPVGLGSPSTPNQTIGGMRTTPKTTAGG